MFMYIKTEKKTEWMCFSCPLYIHSPICRGI